MGLTIGKLAKAARVPTSTIRYYERIGLLRADARTDGNYRVYGEAALERLRFIRAAHDCGFTLEDVASLLNLRRENDRPCEDVQELIERRLGDVRRRLADLKHAEHVLSENLAKCRESAGGDHCHVIDKLNTVAGEAVEASVDCRNPN